MTPPPNIFDRHQTKQNSTEHGRAWPSKTQQMVKGIQYFTEQECWALLGDMLYLFDRGLKGEIIKFVHQ